MRFEKISKAFSLSITRESYSLCLRQNDYKFVLLSSLMKNFRSASLMAWDDNLHCTFIKYLQNIFIDNIFLFSKQLLELAGQGESRFPSFTEKETKAHRGYMNRPKPDNDTIAIWIRVCVRHLLVYPAFLWFKGEKIMFNLLKNN